VPEQRLSVLDPGMPRDVVPECVPHRMRRLDRVTARLIDCRCFASKPRSRPATAKLATRRLTSHSNGPGSVSSKSLMLNTSRRSGAANPTDSSTSRRTSRIGTGGQALERQRLARHDEFLEQEVKLDHGRSAQRPDAVNHAAANGVLV
jgi:hypothetical protein